MPLLKLIFRRRFTYWDALFLAATVALIDHGHPWWAAGVWLAGVIVGHAGEDAYARTMPKMTATGAAVAIAMMRKLKKEQVIITPGDLHDLRRFSARRMDDVIGRGIVFTLVEEEVDG